MAIVRARQDETLDALLYRTLGRTAGVMESTLDANPGLADIGPCLPQGTPVQIPDVAPLPTQRNTLQLWD